MSPVKHCPTCGQPIPGALQPCDGNRQHGGLTADDKRVERRDDDQ